MTNLIIRSIIIFILLYVAIIHITANKSYEKGYYDGSKDAFKVVVDTITKILDRHKEKPQEVGKIIFCEKDTITYYITLKNCDKLKK